MPELPEVEVTRRGVAPHILQQEVQSLILRCAGLRWPFPPGLGVILRGQTVHAVQRRGKYLLLEFDAGWVLIHLGMSGHLRVLPHDAVPQKHDHVDIVFSSRILRMTDPRRFGALLWHPRSEGEVLQHPLLRGLGIEPLESGFDAAYLYAALRKRQSAIKQTLLAGDVVVGVGNIYASESLFLARIHPKTAAHRIGLARCERLVRAIRETLSKAIELGGSSLKDFIGVDGQSGYFQQTYFVYGRTGQPCRVCGAQIRQIQQAQRSTFYCQHCQK